MSRIITTAAICAAFTLSACGKQEAVSDVPSSEELAAQADAASKALRDEAEGAATDDVKDDAIDMAALVTYSNALRSYSILAPKDWTVDESRSDDNGRVYTDPQSTSEMQVSWKENREDKAFAARVEELKAATGETGEAKLVSENNFRASMIDNGDTRRAARLMRKADGTMVEALITYPIVDAAIMDTMASRLLDSLAIQ